MEVTQWEDLNLHPRAIKALREKGLHGPEQLAGLQPWQVREKIKKWQWVGASTVDVINEWLSKEGLVGTRSFPVTSSQEQHPPVPPPPSPPIPTPAPPVPTPPSTQAAPASSDWDWPGLGELDLPELPVLEEPESNSREPVTHDTQQDNDHLHDPLRDAYWGGIAGMVTHLTPSLLRAGYAASEIPQIAVKLAVDIDKEFARWREGYDPATGRWKESDSAQQEAGASVSEEESDLVAQGFVQDPRTGKWILRPDHQTVSQIEDSRRTRIDEMQQQGYVFNSQTRQWVPRPPEQAAVIQDADQAPRPLPNRGATMPPRPGAHTARSEDWDDSHLDAGEDRGAESLRDFAVVSPGDPDFFIR